jgi:predicted RNA-binding Zn ribbon-like protein
MAERSPPPPPRPQSVDDSLPFRFVGGDVSLDLVNTADWTARGPERDRLGSYTRVVEWAAAAGLVDEQEASRLRRRAASRAADAAAVHARAMALRWTIRRLVAALADDAGDSATARVPLEELNSFVAESFGHARLSFPKPGTGDAESRPRWSWARDPDRLDAFLWPIVRAAAELIASPDAARLRVCPGPDCGWVYVDRSRNGLRRWCEMSTCGTQEKTRRRRARST